MGEREPTGEGPEPIGAPAEPTQLSLGPTGRPEQDSRTVNSRIALGVLVVVCLSDYLVYRGTGGAGLAALTASLAAVIAAVRSPRLAGRVCLLGGLCAAAAGRLVWQSGPLGMWAAVGVLAAFAAQAAGLPLHIPELILSALRSVLASPAGLWAAVRVAHRRIRQRNGESRAGSHWLPVVLPVLTVGAFALLFWGANPVLRAWAAPLWRWFVDELLDYVLPTPGHVLFWAVCGLLAVALLRPRPVVPRWLNRLLGSGEDLVPGEPAEKNDQWAAAARNTLIAVSLLFFAYNALDVRFLWLRQAPPEGVTLSQYARTGAAWLTAALALTSAVLGLIYRGQLNFHRRTPQLHVLSWLWLALNAVLALGTYRRLQLYIDYNGLTRARIVGIVGVTLVVIGLLVAALKMQRRRTWLWMVRRQLAVLAAGCLLLALTPMDLLVTSYNTRLILAGEFRPTVQLIVQPLSAEGVPGLIPLLHCPEARIARGVAALLQRQRAKLSREQRSCRRWTQWEWSRERALDAIEAAEPGLSSLVPPDAADSAVRELDVFTKPWF